MIVDTKVIDQMIKQGLNKEGLIRLASVELVVENMKNKVVNDPEYMAKQCEKIYNFLMNNQTK